MKRYSAAATAMASPPPSSTSLATVSRARAPRRWVRSTSTSSNSIRTEIPVADGPSWGVYRTWVKENDPCEHERSGGESWAIFGVAE